MTSIEMEQFFAGSAPTLSRIPALGGNAMNPEHLVDRIISESVLMCQRKNQEILARQKIITFD